MAERLTRLCGAGAPFRPFFLPPFRPSMFRGRKTSLINHRGQRPQCNRRSIGDIVRCCQLDSREKINLKKSKVMAPYLAFSSGNLQHASWRGATFGPLIGTAVSSYNIDSTNLTRIVSYTFLSLEDSGWTEPRRYAAGRYGVSKLLIARTRRPLPSHASLLH
jgi:hypothetical protein